MNYSEELTALEARIRTDLCDKIIKLVTELRGGIAGARVEPDHRPAVMTASVMTAKAKAPALRKQKRHRKPTVATEEQIMKVLEVIDSAQSGVALTIKQINQLCNKMGQTTVSKACAALVERKRIDKAGKGYRSGSNQTAEQPVSNGADESAEA